MPFPGEVMQILNWLPLVLILGAALVCFTHLQLSRRMWWLVAGFFTLGLADLGVRAVYSLHQAQKLALPDVGPALTTLLAVRFVGWGVILAGLIAVFTDLRDRV